MNVQKAVRTVICAGCFLLLCYLSGCSASFCGFRLGNQEELVFTCAEELPVQQEAPAGDQTAAEEQEASAEDRTAAEEQESSGEEEASAGKVDLNTAGIEELMTLKGVGETRAKAIIEYRTQNGRFTRIEDIMQIPGIKEGIFSKIRNQITVH